MLAHSTEVNCLDFNKFMPHLIATGGADTVRACNIVACCGFEAVNGRAHAVDVWCVALPRVLSCR